MTPLLFKIIKTAASGKQSLIVFQNNNELRATGGFITSAFEIDGFSLRFRNVFGELDQHKKVNGPPPLMDMLQDGQFKSWTFRDANFSPDFNESAKELIKFYRLVYPKKKIQNLIAVNYQFVENYLKKLGPIRIDGKTIAYHKLFYFLSAEVSDIDRHNLDALRNRKNILKRLGKKLILASILRVWTWPALIKLYFDSISSRDIQVYPSIRRSAFNPKPSTDFLAVIDSNFLGRKSNRYIQRNLNHDTEITSDGKVKNDLRVTWEHFGTSNRPLSGLYQAYIRIYLPKKISNIKTFSSHPVRKIDQWKELGCTVLGFKLLINPKTKFLFNLSYELNLKTKSNYQFKFFKQSGLIRESLTKTVSFPRSYTIIPGPEGVYSEHLFSQNFSKINQDIELNLKCEKSLNPPRILKHEIVAPNEVQVQFSEPVKLPRSKSKIQLFNKMTKKAIQIQSIKILNNGKTLSIRTRELPDIKGQFYELELTDIKNSDRVSISPNPRTVTVVYRPHLF